MRQNGTRNATAAVVVTHNRMDLLKKCLESLAGQTCPCDVLVVNNASTDGTAQWLEIAAQGRTAIRVQTLPVNAGGAGGFYHGIRWAVEEGYDRLWLMDDDCIPHADALEKLAQADAVLEGNFGWLSSVALWTDGSECRMNRQKLKKSFYEYSPLLKYGLVQAEQATFVSLYLKAETVRRFGLPIREFFIWGDDIEYTRRIAVRGGVPGFVAGQSQVIHAAKSNVGSNVALDDPERLGRYFYAFRNEAFLYRQEGIRGRGYCFAKRCRDFLRIARSGRPRIRRFRTLFRGIWAGFFFRPAAQYLQDTEPEK